MKTKLLNNRYQVIEVLSAGGFGETFLAEDIHMPSRRRCVIKQLKPITSEPQIYQQIQQRFEREAATLEYLGEGSDQIPQLYAYFSENGQFYLVQEWIQGQTLTQVVQSNGTLNETAVRDILLSLLSVLDYVHSKGIIHRDIKPDNIILRNLSTPPFQGGIRGDRPVLIDFGAVKETIVSVVNHQGYPTQSMVIGTPGYMPSEQAVGRPVYATDIYSLGLTAIYLLTGKHPHELETHLQTGEIIWQDHAPNVSPQLAMILNQAIKPHASDRFTTASKMLYALQSGSNLPSTPTAATQPTVTLRKNPATSYRPTQPLSPSPSSSQNIPRNGQKLTWVFGSLLTGGLIGAVAIAAINRKPASDVTVATSPTPTPFVESNTSSPTPTVTPTNTPVSSQPPPVAIVPTSPRRQVTPAPVPLPTSVTPQLPQESLTQEFPTVEVPDETPSSVTSTPQQVTPKPVTPKPVIPTPTPAPVTPTPKPQAENPNDVTQDTNISGVPGFPTGTSESAVKATLGKPSKVSRGLWNTRAFLYRLQPNRVDLGYLFDKKSGMLRQTEVSFAQSVEPEVMQTTLQGMLGGKASSQINQGLQQVYQRQSNEYSFNVGGLEGVIQRNEEDQIYIGVWDADLH